MPAPTPQGSSIVVHAATTFTVTPALPAHQTDDILITTAWIRTTTGNLVTPSGWTSLADYVRGTSARYRVAWKRATSSAESDPTWTLTGGASADKFTQAHVIRGCLTGASPWDVTATTTGTADPAVATGATPTVDECLIVSLGGNEDNIDTAATITATDPASWGTFSATDNRYDVDAGGTDGGAWLGFAAQTTAAATGSVSHDLNGVSRPGWGILIGALKPADTATDLVVQEATQAQTADTATLTQVHNLAVDDAAHGHSTDSPTLTQLHNITTHDASQAQPADSPTLSQTHVLVIADALHTQTADTVNLEETAPFVPALVGLDGGLTAGSLDGPSATVGAQDGQAHSSTHDGALGRSGDLSGGTTLTGQIG